MNTTSVTVNKSIPDNSKIEGKAKSGKGKDKFKDMIKNVSESKSFVNKDKSVDDKPVSKTKTSAGLENDDGQDGSADITDVALFLLPQTGIVDPMQLMKIMQAPSEHLGLVENTLADSQIAQVQATSEGSAAKVLQGTVNTVFVTEKNTIAPFSLTYAAQPLQEEPQQEKISPLFQQSLEIDAEEISPQVSKSPKEVLQQMELGAENALRQGEEAVLVPEGEMKPLHGKEVQEAKVMIKVGDPALNSSWEQAAKEIGNMVVERINNEIQKVSIKLNPKNLGEIKVEFFMEDGKISVLLNCSNEGTKSLLAANLDTLSRVVQSSLMQETNVSVHYEKTDGQNSDNEHFDGGGQGQSQGEESGRRKEQEQADLDFAQRLRLGIETLDDMEG